MGIVQTEITLKNVKDMHKAEFGVIKEEEIRQTTVNAVVDTRTWTLVINEALREELGLTVTRTESGTLADGIRSVYNLVGPLEVRWKDRFVICEALVIPNAKETLLGAIPLDTMDLTINPRNEEAVGAHGDQVVHLIL